MEPIDKYYGNNEFGSGLINQPFGGYDKSYNTQSFQSGTKGLDFNNNATGDVNNNGGGSNMGINAGVGALNTLSSLSDSYNTGGQPHYTSQGMINNDKKWFETGAAKSALKGASTGASIGGMTGNPIVAAAGAVVGGVVGGIVGAGKDKKENREVKKENSRISTENFFGELSNTRQKNDEINYNKQHSDAKLNNIFSSLNNINTQTNSSNRKYTIENGTMYNNSENGLLPITY